MRQDSRHLAVIMERLYREEENLSLEAIDTLLEKKQRQVERPKYSMNWISALCLLNGVAFVINLYVFVASHSYWHHYTEKQVRLKNDGMFDAIFNFEHN